MVPVVVHVPALLDEDAIVITTLAGYLDNLI